MSDFKSLKRHLSMTAVVVRMLVPEGKSFPAWWTEPLASMAYAANVFDAIKNTKGRVRGPLLVKPL